MYLFLSARAECACLMQAFSPGLTMLALFMADIDRPTSQLIMAVLLIAVETVIASYGEVNLDMMGMLCMLAAESIEATRLVMTQILLVDLKFHQSGLNTLQHNCLHMHECVRKASLDLTFTNMQVKDTNAGKIICMLTYLAESITPTPQSGCSWQIHCLCACYLWLPTMWCTVFQIQLGFVLLWHFDAIFLAIQDRNLLPKSVSLTTSNSVCWFAVEGLMYLAPACFFWLSAGAAPVEWWDAGQSCNTAHCRQACSISCSGGYGLFCESSGLPSHSDNVISHTQGALLQSQSSIPYVCLLLVHISVYGIWWLWIVCMNLLLRTVIALEHGSKGISLGIDGKQFVYIL